MRVADCPCCELSTPVLEMAPNDVVLIVHDDADGVTCPGRGRTVPPGDVRELLLDAGCE